MTQDRYVTSTCITNIQRNLNDKLLPSLKQLKKDVDSTSVSFPGFGTIGVLLIGKYGSTQNDIRRMVDDAIATVEAWIESLETIKKNWREAEEKSIVVYR
ncbi:hypothetical protein [Streptosporangium sp. NPDC087985]|uniref:hypothetical protein n=1 Tax=Streptosporangium sp. NPDC087985 TaxID=3366196 RepID=UPI0038291B8B